MFQVRFLAVLLFITSTISVIAFPGQNDVTFTHNGEELIELDVKALGSATLYGKIINSFNDRRIKSFQGLPYSSEPPTGANRFQIMALAEPFEGDTSYDATYIRSKCGQRANIHAGDITAAGSEDCLYLNVYVPEDPSSEKLPVMIFFHGGGFVWGDSSLYLPTRLLDEDVILVTVHYRLGALSFFTIGDHRAVGNLALYDQNLAMKWVQEYISDFGGDKDKVTIFGQSAGSASVNYHLISELSEGLMAGVIAESGSAIDVWALDDYPIESSFDLAPYITGCESIEVVDKRNPTDDELTALYTCMNRAPFEDLAIASDLLSIADRRKGGMGFRAASPSIQGSGVSSPIVTQDPFVALQNGEFNTNVSLMNGACAQEGTFVFGVMYSAFLYPDKVDDAFYLENEMIGDVLTAIGIEDHTGVIGSSLKRTYFPDIEMTSLDAVTPGMIDMLGALFLKSGAKFTADLHSIWSTAGTYLYSFEYEGSGSMFNFLFWGSGEARPPFDHGVTHTDDLLYVFSLPTALTDKDIETSNKMVKLWTNFAKYQNPTPEEQKSDEVTLPKWTSYDLENQQFMQMKDDFTIQTNYENRYTINGDLAYSGTTTESGSSTEDGTTMDGSSTSHTDSSTDDDSTMDGSSTSHTDDGSTTEADSSVSTTETTTPDSKDRCDYDPSYEEIDDKREAYLITMIVFIIATVILMGITTYVCMKYK